MDHPPSPVAELAPQDLRISTTLQAVLSDVEGRTGRVNGVAVCTARELIVAVLERHSHDYAGDQGLAIASEVVSWPVQPRHSPVRERFVGVESMVAESMDVVHGRVSILGLCLFDRATGRAAVAGGLFAAIAAEIDEGIDGLLSARGRERNLSIPLACR
jgi:hypothetical protein